MATAPNTTTQITSNITPEFEKFYLGTPATDTAAARPGLIEQYFQQTSPQQSYFAKYGNVPFGQYRVAGPTSSQEKVGTALDDLVSRGTPWQLNQGASWMQSGAQGIAGLMNQQPQQVGTQALNQFQMQQPANVQAQNYGAPTMQAAQGAYNPQVQAFQMQAPRDVYAADRYQGVSSTPLSQYQMTAPDQFTSAAAQKYMSPYMQNVLDIQKREAVRDANIGQLQQNLASARQGTYGGARQAILQTERERQLGTRLSDIQAAGLQSAYTNAQQQFGADRAATQAAQQANLQSLLQTQQLGSGQNLQAQLANQQAGISMGQQGLQAQLANQQAGLTTGQQNLAAQLAAQQLGVSTGAQFAMANLTNQQQANVQNMAAQLQTQGLNAEQAMKAALANQQAGLTTGQQNLQAQLGVQQFGATQDLEAQRLNQAAGLQALQQQFGGYQTMGQIGQGLGTMGVQSQAAEMDRLKGLSAYGDFSRGLSQQKLDYTFADQMAAANFPQQQLEAQNAFLRGVPLNQQTQVQTAPPPSLSSQLMGLGVAGLGAYNIANK